MENGKEKKKKTLALVWLWREKAS